MSHVDLGFIEKCEAWQVQSYQFPSKIGGKPAWLDLENLPSPEDLLCDTCKKPLIFLSQIYAPYEEDDANFHRTVFVFICREATCSTRNTSTNIKVFRNSLTRKNRFYSYDPPNENTQDKTFVIDKWVKLCNLCGCLANKHCSKCKQVAYCSREHQIIDWRENHKKQCNENEAVASDFSSSKLFAEYEVIIEGEEVREKTVNEAEELEKCKKLEETGTMQEIPEEEIEQHATADPDKTFTRFKKATEENSDQILRYARGGEPLWIASEPQPENIPDCEFCGGPRQFEFQIMPQLLSILKEHDLDFGIIVVYTCKQSCTQGQIRYKREFVFKQDVAMNDF